MILGINKLDWVLMTLTTLIYISLGADFQRVMRLWAIFAVISLFRYQNRTDDPSEELDEAKPHKGYKWRKPKRDPNDPMF